MTDRVANPVVLHSYVMNGVRAEEPVMSAFGYKKKRSEGQSEEVGGLGAY